MAAHGRRIVSAVAPTPSWTRGARGAWSRSMLPILSSCGGGGAACAPRMSSFGSTRHTLAVRRASVPSVAVAHEHFSRSRPIVEVGPPSRDDPTSPAVVSAIEKSVAPEPKEAPVAAISALEMFSVGIGPSSSHTVGPMRAAQRFASLLAAADGGALLKRVGRVKCDLYGSLALTGVGHGTPGAVTMGLEGNLPDTVDVEGYQARLEAISADRVLMLNGEHPVAFDPRDCLPMHMSERLPLHSNGMEFTAYAAGGDGVHHEGDVLLARRYYSVGGGFFVGDKGVQADDSLAPAGALAEETSHSQRAASPPFPFRSADELLSMCAAAGLSIPELQMANEVAWHGSREAVEAKLLGLWRVMDASIERGLHTEGILPGGLRVRRRAPGLMRALQRRRQADAGRRHTDVFHGLPLDALSMWAIAVNEENAAGGRVVTAPTNGAAGVIPAVLRYYIEHVHPHLRPRIKATSPASQPGAAEHVVAESPVEALERAVCEFLLTAGVIGMLFKSGASLSAAEVGCQGEVGVACSMASGALCHAMGGSIRQIESASEIAMEHNLGLSCDPAGGLVQVPCIERNVMGAVKAVTACRLALSNSFDEADGGHTPVVSLDTVIATMLATGRDMSERYKETSLGGLSVHVSVNMPEC